MGTKTAPSYANIVMGKVENTIINNAENKPDNWMRYIDDIRFYWKHGEIRLKQFHEYCNTVHPTLKFTIDYNSDSIPFLDTTMLKDERKIETTIYTKPTDKHSYLWSTSCHPSHVFRSIPWSQSLRYRRICSTTDKFNQASLSLQNHLKKRGYKEETIKSAIQGAREMDRSIFFNNRNTS